MSEARDDAMIQQLGEAYVVATPGIEFSHQLERFYSDTRRQLGGRALSLISDRRLRVFHHRPPHAQEDQSPNIVTLKELSAMQTNLRRRGEIHPIVDDTLIIEPERDMKGEIVKNPGMTLRFHILVDKLTAQALRSSWLVDNEQAIAMHITVPREHLRIGSELLDARDDIKQALRATPPLSVNNLRVSSHNVHI